MSFTVQEIESIKKVYGIVDEGDIVPEEDLEGGEEDGEEQPRDSYGQ